ncbi:hypothetical protein RZS08_49495, partial [Arthrospira platensis SPKY1]|nr:hypothetical protein [Arthrospira platensis SPKY1]
MGSDIVYAVEVEWQMDATETAIAEEVRHQTGLEVRVEVQDQEQLGFLLNLGYATPFIFSSETDDGQIHYYTVSDLPATSMETVC